MCPKYLVLFFYVAGIGCTVAQSSQGNRRVTCRQWFDECELTFAGSNQIPMYNLSIFNTDTTFTSRIQPKNLSSPLLGIANTKEPAEYLQNGKPMPVTSLGDPPAAPTIFKTFPIPFPKVIPASGVGHETFQGNQLSALSGKCFRLYITSYQILDSQSLQVVDNVNDAPKSMNKCVVFKTAMSTSQ